MHFVVSTYFILYLLALAIPAYALPGGLSKAGSAVAIDGFTADLNGDGEEESVSLCSASSVEGEAIGIIQVWAKGKVYATGIGPLDSPEMSSVESVCTAKGVKPFIMVMAPGGAHGMHALIHSFTGTEIRKELSVFSDAPSIEFCDIDDDGVNELVSKKRDYDHDPITNTSMDIYKYTNGRWHIYNPAKNRDQQGKVE